MSRKFFLTILTLLTFGLILYQWWTPRKKGEIISPLSESAKKEESLPSNPARSKEELLTKIKDLFAESADTDFAVSILNLKTNESFGINDKEAQHAASITKVLTGVFLLKRVEEGKLKLTDKLGAFNIEFNLKQMINQSNTEAWELIDDFLGLDPQQNFANSLRLFSVKFKDNLMSPQDATLLFAKLYKGELLSEGYQRKILSYMQNTETENLITPSIPLGIPFYHKSGLFEGQVHDVGIIDHPDSPFILAIFSMNKIYPDYEGRAKLIQKVTSEVYTYFTR